MKELLITCIIFYFQLGDKKKSKSGQAVQFILTYIGILIGTIISKKYFK